MCVAVYLSYIDGSLIQLLGSLYLVSRASPSYAKERKGLVKRVALARPRGM